MYSFVIVWWGSQNGTQVAFRGTVTDRSLREIVEKCTFTGGVEPRPYAESPNFKVKTVRRQYMSMRSLGYDREAYIAERQRKSRLQIVEKCTFAAERRHIKKMLLGIQKYMPSKASSHFGFMASKTNRVLALLCSALLCSALLCSALLFRV